MLQIIGGALAAIFGAAVTGLAVYLATLKIEKRRNLASGTEELRELLDHLQDIQVDSVDLERSGLEPKTDTVMNFETERRGIARKLQHVDDLPEMRDVVRVTRSLRYRSEQERAEAISRVRAKMSARLGPNLSKAWTEVKEENLALRNQDKHLYENRRRWIAGSYGFADLIDEVDDSPPGMSDHSKEW